MTRFPEPLRSALVEAVDAASKIIAAQEPLDVVQVTTPIAAGGLTSTAVGRGVRTSIAIRRAIEASSEAVRLRGHDRSALPSFITIGGAGHAVEVGGVVAMLAEAVHAGRVETPERAVENLEDVMGARSVTMRARAPLRTVHFEPRVDHGSLPCELGNGVVLRLLSDQERTTERAPFDDGRAALDGLLDHSVLDTLFEVPASFSAGVASDSQHMLEAVRKEQMLIERILHAHAALHVAIPGRAPLRMVLIESTSPILRSQRAILLMDGPVFSFMDLNELTLERASIMKAAATTSNGRVQVGMRRLRDAAIRTRWEDSLLDAAIGLEALLNAENKDEITMRMALNYASLFPMADRVARAQAFRDVYRVRSKVAHGEHLDGATEEKLGDEKRPRAEFATAAREMLREVLVAFLSDPTLLAQPKLTTRAWEERYYRDVTSD